MFKRVIMWGGLALLLLPLAGFRIWLSTLPPAVIAAPAPVPQSEMDAMVAALKPPKRERPLIAVVGLNDATEVNDYLMTTGILRRAGVADIVTLASAPGRVKLYPALTAEAEATLAEFDARNPTGADYVIVPAMSRDDDPTIGAWLKSQARNGAIIVGVCAGAKVVAAAGLLDGKLATTHWYYLNEMLKRSPSISYVPNRRMVVDNNVATTTGITAAVPMMLTLIEAIAGQEKAQAVAQDLGVSAWDASHASEAFKFTRSFATTVLANALSFWDRESIAIEVHSGIDEVSLALVADAWSRTYRSKAVIMANSAEAVESRNGIRIVPDLVAANVPPHMRTSRVLGLKPFDALDQTLLEIGSRFGPSTAEIVAMQLEYTTRRHED